MRKTLAAAAVGVLILGRAPGAGAQCGRPFEVPASTPRDVIAKMIVDQMFSDMVLTEAQETKAVTVVLKKMTDAAALDYRAPDYRQKLALLATRQNADLMALLTKKTDKAKLTACFKLEGGAPGGGGGVSPQ